MGKLWGIVFTILLLVATASFSGCVNGILPFKATPQPSISPTVVPTPVPTATPNPTPVVNQHSPDVKIRPTFTTFDFAKYDLEQTETITVVVINDGVIAANNIKLILSVADAQRGYNLVTKTYDFGGLNRGDYKAFAMTTPKHAAANSVYVTVYIVWGEYGEYSSLPDTFVNKAYSVYL